MVKITQNIATEEFLIENHPDQTGNQSIAYYFNINLDRVDRVDVLATVLGGDKFLPINHLRIYGTTNYYGYYMAYQSMTLGSPQTMIVNVCDLYSTQATLDVKFIFSKYI